MFKGILIEPLDYDGARFEHPFPSDPGDELFVDIKMFVGVQASPHDLDLYRLESEQKQHRPTQPANHCGTSPRGYLLT